MGGSLFVIPDGLMDSKFSRLKIVLINCRIQGVIHIIKCCNDLIVVNQDVLEMVLRNDFLFMGLKEKGGVSQFGISGRLVHWKKGFEFPLAF